MHFFDLKELEFIDIIENSEKRIIIFDDNNRIVYVDTEIPKILNEDIKLINGKNINSFIPQQKISLCKNSSYTTQFSLNYNNQTLDIEISSINISEDKKLFVCTLNKKNQEKKLNLLKNHISKNHYILQNSPIALLITDTDNKIVFVNKSLCKMTGFEIDELLGETPKIFKSDKTQKIVYQEMWSKLNKGENWEGYFINKKKNGDEYIEKNSIFSIKNKNGEVLNFVSIKQDVTLDENRKKILENQNEEMRILMQNIRITNKILEEKNNIIKEKEERQHNILSNLGEGLGILNFSEVFIYANKSACEIFEVETLKGRNLKDFLDKEEWEKVQKQTALRKHKKNSTYNLKIISEKGNKKHLSLTVTPDNDVNGKPKGAIGVFRDITKIVDYQIQLMKKNDIINKQYDEIKSGLYYAKNLQNSLLLDINKIRDYLYESFLIFIPKDIVSGDFYYINEIGNKIIVAVADCIGHGVAGAFMSIMGINYLQDMSERILNLTPAQILTLFRKKIKNTFSEFGNENPSSIDIALCIIDIEKNELQYAGAFIPLYLVREKKITEYRATKNPIGFYYVETDFVDNTIQLLDKDTIYLSSDGFSDQFSSNIHKKFGKKRFTNMLLNISNVNFDEQKDACELIFSDWKSGAEQIDDVTILGFRWNI